MNLDFDLSVATNYHSNAQRARVLTENWIANNMYCPRCGSVRLAHLKNNQKVADFCCPSCKNEFELKSKSGKLSSKMNDGAYSAMIERITSLNNPDFFFLSYDKEKARVVDLMFVPKYLFVPQVIEKRKKLSDDARRKGWVGCNILLNSIPSQGRITIVHNGNVIEKEDVLSAVAKARSLQVQDITSRGWLFDVLNCVNALPQVFSLSDVYKFTEVLQAQHPDNNHIEAKIRQQLQLLRDKGFLQFLGSGMYRRL